MVSQVLNLHGCSSHLCSISQFGSGRAVSGGSFSIAFLIRQCCEQQISRLQQEKRQIEAATID